MGIDKEESLPPGEAIADFMQRNRKSLLALIVILAGGIIGLVAFFAVRSGLQKDAIITLEEIEERLTLLGDLSENAKSAEVEALLQELTEFASGTFGYAAARSYSLAAAVYMERNEWEKAEQAYLDSARKAGKTYLAPLALYNAAAAAEEQGNLETALEYYTQSLDFSGNFPGASRARFNIGRIYEAQKDTEAASDAYRTLIENSSPDSNWAKLAQSRIIFLEISEQER
ncbi:MAG: tetratricopeptide repeat protein [Spirochaetaceae bacterium]|jgi:tetratricopeptide (TPR) repeat protein|nr:tetratricopeptide repeat protein [Spirochaetaceae bacterium]